MAALEVTVGAVAHGGHFVARHEGRVIFVRHALPGERVRVELTESGEDAHFWRADVVEVLEAAPERVTHFWPAADSLRTHAAGELPVGGAEFGHIERGFQRELKGRVLAEQLQRLAGLKLSTPVQEVPGEQPDGLGWRSRAGFAVTPEGRLGMHAHRSNTVIAVQDMPLAVQRIRSLPLWELDFTGIERVEIAAPDSGDGPLVLLAGAKAAAARVSAELPEGLSVAHWDPEHSRVSALRGRPWLREHAVDRDFRVSGDGFWQIHRSAPSVLSGAVSGLLSEVLRPGARWRTSMPVWVYLLLCWRRLLA